MKSAKKLIQENIVIDNAFGFEPEIEVPYKWEVIQRYAKAGFSHLSLSIATDMTSLETTMHYLAECRKIIAQTDNLVLAESAQDILAAKKAGKLALSFMFQGSNPIEKNIDLIEPLVKLGVKSMLIAYNINNAMGSGCIEPHDGGLSLLGKKLVAEMNRHGMIIDLSHTGYKTSMDAMAISSKPVIFSHSNVAKLHPHQRNLQDDQIIAAAKTDGFIGINGNGPLLGDAQASAQKYVDHVEYIINLVGDDYVGLGTDYVYFPEIFDAFMKKNGVVYPSNYGVGKIESFRSTAPENLQEIVIEMQKRGIKDASIIKFLGGNYLRVLQA